MNATTRAFLDHVLDQVGDQVRYGAEATQADTDPKVWDSSELVEWSANRAGAAMPDGSWRQYRALHDQGAATDATTALHTPGALLFKFSSDPTTGMPAQRQVYVSLGDGRVVEATGAHGVRIVDAKPQEFTHAAIDPALRSDGDDADLRAHLGERLQSLGVDTGTPAATPETPATPDTPAAPDTPVPVPDTPHVSGDPIALRKQALDASQEAQRLRDEADHGEQHQRDLEAKAAAARQEIDTHREQAAHEQTLARGAKLEAEQYAGDAGKAQADLDGNRATMSADDIKAAEARIAQLQQQAQDARAESDTHFAEMNRHQDEVVKLDDAVASYDHGAEAAKTTIAEVRAQADEAQNRAADIFSKSNVAISDRVPDNPLQGAGQLGQPSPRDVKIVDVPPAPPANATRDQVQEWVKQRDLATQSREDAAAAKLKDSVDFDNIAETKRAFVDDAQSHAAAARQLAATEQARLQDLQSRLGDAQAQDQRFSDQMIQEQQQAERLRALGDTAGAAASDARTDQLMQQQMSWHSQAFDLQQRIDASQKAFAAAQEDASDYDHIAQQLNEEITRATEMSTQYKQEAQQLQQQADQLDQTTDKVQDVLGTNINSEVHVITPTEDVDVNIPGRNVQDVPPNELPVPTPVSTSVDSPPATTDTGAATSTIDDTVAAAASLDATASPSDGGAAVATSVDTGTDTAAVATDAPPGDVPDAATLGDTDATTFDVPSGDGATADPVMATAGDGSDPGEIEMPPMDLSGDTPALDTAAPDALALDTPATDASEIEMPPLDMTADATTAEAPSPDPPTTDVALDQPALDQPALDDQPAVDPPEIEMPPMDMTAGAADPALDPALDQIATQDPALDQPVDATVGAPTDDLDLSVENA